MPANILNLSDYTVTGVTESEHDYHIDAVTKEAPRHCSNCFARKLEGFGRRKQMIKDLPMHGRRVGIYIQTRRYRCQECKKTFYEDLPEINYKRLMTDRLVSWIGKQCAKRTFSSIAEEVGVAEGTIRLVFKDYILEMEEHLRFETPQWMGIDEIQLIKPRGVIANIQNNTIVELLPNRSEDTIIKYLSNLEGRETIQYVAMDMWAPYRDACQLVIPDARIIIDKFHIMKMVNEAIERVRKGLRARLTMKEKRGLMHDRFVLLKRERDLTDQDRLKLSGWVRNYDALGAAYKLKEDFFKIYDAKSPDEAQTLYIAWKCGVTPEVAPAFSDLIRAWENWTPFILGYFDHPVTNAYTGSLNSLIRMTNRLGRGYSFEALRANMLFAEGVHKIKKEKFNRSSTESEHPAIGNRLFTLSPQTEDIKKNYGADIATLIELIEKGEL